jgi:hypothetical protein
MWLPRLNWTHEIPVPGLVVSWDTRVLSKASCGAWGTVAQAKKLSLWAAMARIVMPPGLAGTVDAVGRM